MSRISTFFLASIFVFCFQAGYSQQPLVALHHQGSASFFTSLTEAYNAAVNGDTLYIPGGNFEMIALNKSLALIGVGYHPDSTSSTGATILAYLDIYNESDGSYITGIGFNGPVYVYDDVSSLTISRCYLGRGFFFQTNSQQLSDWALIENWIGKVNSPPCYECSFISNGGKLLSNFIVSNNVIEGPNYYISPFFNSIINNNAFLLGVTVNANYSVFKNNVCATNFLGSTNNSKWYYNLNAGVNGTSGTNIGSDNYLDGIPFESIFVNYSTGNNFYQNDFHVVNPAYVGDDGAPVGIFGGLYPWKEGSLPFNPHIKSLQVQSATNPDGNLHISAAVRAEQN